MLGSEGTVKPLADGDGEDFSIRLDDPLLGIRCAPGKRKDDVLRASLLSTEVE